MAVASQSVIPVPAASPSTYRALSAVEPRRLDPQRLGDHLDRLYRAAWGLCGSREDAEDLVQETYARVLRRPRMLRSEDDLGYLLKVLRNTYFSAHRTAKRRVRAEPLPDDLERFEDPSSMHPEQVLDAREVYAKIAELPEPFREALVAIDVLGLSYREAAQALKVREGTVTTRLYRARLRLATAMTEEEGGREAMEEERRS